MDHDDEERKSEMVVKMHELQDQYNKLLLEEDSKKKTRTGDESIEASRRRGTWMMPFLSTTPPASSKDPTLSTAVTNPPKDGGNTLVSSSIFLSAMQFPKSASSSSPLSSSTPLPHDVSTSLSPDAGRPADALTEGPPDSHAIMTMNELMFGDPQSVTANIKANVPEVLQAQHVRRMSLSAVGLDRQPYGSLPIVERAPPSHVHDVKTLLSSPSSSKGEKSRLGTETLLHVDPSIGTASMRTSRASTLPAGIDHRLPSASPPPSARLTPKANEAVGSLSVSFPPRESTDDLMGPSSSFYYPFLSPLNAIRPPKIVIEPKLQLNLSHSRHSSLKNGSGGEAGVHSTEPSPTTTTPTEQQLQVIKMSRPQDRPSSQQRHKSTGASSFFELYDIKSIGPYKLVKTLGSGSTGKVKLAVHEESGEKIAIKIIPREPILVQASLEKVREKGKEMEGEKGAKEEKDKNKSSNTPESLVKSVPPLPPHPSQSQSQPRSTHNKPATPYETALAREARLLREIALLSLLHHPHVISLFGYSITPAYYVLYMEYAEHGPLLHYVIQHSRLKERQARDFFRQILSAVSYCHQNSIVHRDLKIENILIDSMGRLKLIDFGLSNFYDSSGSLSLSTFCGSLYYAAPELLSGRPYIGPEVDIWSLGVILFVLVTGKVPFEDKKLPVLHEKIKKGHVDYPSYLSSEIKHLIKRCLVVNPRNRATLDELVQHPWVNKKSSGAIGISSSSSSFFSATSSFFTPHFFSGHASSYGGGGAGTTPDQPSTSYHHHHSLPIIEFYVPSRFPLDEPLDSRVIAGVAATLSHQYSTMLITWVLQQAIADWVRFERHPIVSLYYLVKEKMVRWQAERVKLLATKRFSPTAHDHPHPEMPTRAFLPPIQRPLPSLVVPATCSTALQPTYQSTIADDPISEAVTVGRRLSDAFVLTGNGYNIDHGGKYKVVPPPPPILLEKRRSHSVSFPEDNNTAKQKHGSLEETADRTMGEGSSPSGRHGRSHKESTTSTPSPKDKSWFTSWLPSLKFKKSADADTPAS